MFITKTSQIMLLRNTHDVLVKYTFSAGGIYSYHRALNGQYIWRLLVGDWGPMKFGRMWSSVGPTLSIREAG
jgi:hypothetical protein